MEQGAFIIIDRTALKHNFKYIKERAHHENICAIIKSDAYGHGMVRVAQILLEEDTKVDAFGVFNLEAAIFLRSHFQDVPIVILGFNDSSRLIECAKHQLTPVIHRWDQILALQHLRLKKPISVWLKVETGMHRLGIPKEDVGKAYECLKTCESVLNPLCLMTHLAEAFAMDSSFTKEQISVFLSMTQHIPAKTSFMNSAGILAYPQERGDWLRPGVLLYGVSPFINRTGQQEGLKPVMTVVAPLIAVRYCQAGDKIGYGGLWQCPEEMPIGIVGMGYGDGYPRHARSGTPTFVSGKYCPLVGQVSMNMLAIDLRNKPDAHVGDEVVLWGRGLPVETVAAYSDTIAYELLCSVSKRLPIEVRSDV